MTSCWSKSATGKRYPYYWCQTRDCSEYRKSIRAEKIDTGFEAILRAMTPSKRLLTMAGSMLKTAWGQRREQAMQTKTVLRRQISDLEKQQDALLDRIVETSNSKVISALESKITKLEENKLRLNDQLTQNAQPRHTMDEIFELLMSYLSSPWNIYEKGGLLMKKTILKTAFAAPLAYDRKQGFRTPQPSVIFRFLDTIKEKCEMVPRRGLEPPRPYGH
ncbi:hypothetical protein [Pseudaestuariivita rosea]|uniref:hypothetical protein n=1 Tax=Pseudaestuariivita rosea TaxID=2763263 RepID=UPI001F318DBB|nr:hypothetical protein [Pseudaestuariivita rosea]